MLCDQCIETFDEGVIGGQHQYHVQSCLLCSEPNRNVVRLKPKTAGVRLLSVDGGGTRGIVPLEALKLLQNHLGLPCAIQDFFDFAIGTSAGEYAPRFRCQCTLILIQTRGVDCIGPLPKRLDCGKVIGDV
jgi:hypothetical protein